MSTRRKLAPFVAVFVAAYFIPFADEVVQGAVLEAFHMLQEYEYAREHVLFCLIPAFFIAGAIAEAGAAAEVIHVTDINEIVDRGVMMTPAVIVDGEGKVPTADQVLSWLG